MLGLKKNSGVIPFHFKFDTNRPQGTGGKNEKPINLYHFFREMVSESISRGFRRSLRDAIRHSQRISKLNSAP
ncbi:hypothetical protein NIES2109_46620 [Nostoc sp. HK-01]|nr:hypothetical protein NIES2109_46620 [Nostoc sp. HK-01]